MYVDAGSLSWIASVYVSVCADVSVSWYERERESHVLDDCRCQQQPPIENKKLFGLVLRLQ